MKNKILDPILCAVVFKKTIISNNNFNSMFKLNIKTFIVFSTKKIEKIDFFLKPLINLENMRFIGLLEYKEKKITVFPIISEDDATEFIIAITEFKSKRRVHRNKIFSFLRLYDEISYDLTNMNYYTKIQIAPHSPLPFRNFASFLENINFEDYELKSKKQLIINIFEHINMIPNPILRYMPNNNYKFINFKDQELAFWEQPIIDLPIGFLTSFFNDTIVLFEPFFENFEASLNDPSVNLDNIVKSHFLKIKEFGLFNFKKRFDESNIKFDGIVCCIDIDFIYASYVIRFLYCFITIFKSKFNIKKDMRIERIQG